MSQSTGARMRKVSNGIITTVAGNGTPDLSGDGGRATQAGLDPTSIAIDTSGNLYITDGNYRVRKVSGGLITALETSKTSLA